MSRPLSPAEAAALLESVRAETPLVQCLTNAVVTGFTANVLLAVGATPAMVDIPEEAAQFARVADATLINLGTPHTEQRHAMMEAAGAAMEEGRPWVLDPVAVGALPVRTALALDLLEFRPTAVRGNASEVIALAGAGAGGRGVDAVDGTEDAREPASRLARRHRSVVAVSGATDLITDGADVIRVSNGDPLLTRVTGGGCALGAVTAAFLAVAEDRLVAVAAATATYTIAAEVAAARADGPGSFSTAFLDALAEVDGEAIRARLMAA